MDREVNDSQPYTWVGAFVYFHEMDEIVFVGALRFKAEDLVLSRKVASFIEVYGPCVPVSEIAPVTVSFGNLRTNGKAASVTTLDAVYPKGVPEYACARAKNASVSVEVDRSVEGRSKEGSTVTFRVNC